MTRDDVDYFEKLEAQLQGIHREMSSLAKKSPNDAVNAFKIEFINEVLKHCDQFLAEKYSPFAEFDGFDDDDVVSTSDVSFIVSQYLECAEKMRADNIEKDFQGWYWRLDDDGARIRTAPPNKLTRR